MVGSTNTSAVGHNLPYRHWNRTPWGVLVSNRTKSLRSRTRVWKATGLRSIANLHTRWTQKRSTLIQTPGKPCRKSIEVCCTGHYLQHLCSCANTIGALGRFRRVTSDQTAPIEPKTGWLHARSRGFANRKPHAIRVIVIECGKFRGDFVPCC